MIVLALDPGPLQSGYVLFDGVKVYTSGTMENEDLLKIVADDRSDALAIEKIVSYGKAVGDTTFETCYWSGRFAQAWPCPDEVHRITRLQVKTELGLKGSAKDADVNRRLIEVVGPKGSKGAPGPTFGVSSHAWAALAVAVAALKQLGG